MAAEDKKPIATETSEFTRRTDLSEISEKSSVSSQTPADFLDARVVDSTFDINAFLDSKISK